METFNSGSVTKFQRDMQEFNHQINNQVDLQSDTSLLSVLVDTSLKTKSKLWPLQNLYSLCPKTSEL